MAGRKCETGCTCRRHAKCKNDCICGRHFIRTDEIRRSYGAHNSKCEIDCNCQKHANGSSTLYTCVICDVEFRDKTSAQRKTCSKSCGGKIPRVHSKGIKFSLEARANMSKAQKGRIITEEARGKMSQTRKRLYAEGALIAWNMGKRADDTIIVRSSIRLWRQQVFERDNYTCQICSQKGGRLDADHIISRWANPSLIYNVFNGRTLCHECHKQTDTYGRKAIRRPNEFQIPLPLVA